MKKICFMVMPFRTKPVSGAREGAPVEVNFDRLWDLAYRPALDELGYLPVRADSDTGSVILKDMLNRLSHSDLVIADLSLPNGNVYYEVGVRYVAKEVGCVLVAADWSKQLFDVDQMTTLRFPLADGAVPDVEAAAIKEHLVSTISALNDSRSPYYELVERDVYAAFQDEAQAMSDFQAELGRVRYLDGDEMKAAVDDLLTKHGGDDAPRQDAALELLYLARDYYPSRENANWEAVRALIEGLPGSMRAQPVFREQYALAISNLGDHAGAIAALEAHFGGAGWTPESCGLAGGRHKRLYREAQAAREAKGDQAPSPKERKHLAAAIDYYERGMNLDLNEYYCASNLPGLLRERGAPDDAARATSIEALILLACQRAKKMGSPDSWLEHTLFGTAFRGISLDLLEQLTREVESGVPWQIGSTLADAEGWIKQAPAEAQTRLQAFLDRLRAVDTGSA